MVDFISALKVGLNSAEIAEKNKREIDEVFAELNRQLVAQFDNKVGIEIIVPTLDVEPEEMSLAYLKTLSPQWIYAVNPQSPPTDKGRLAGFKSGESGYPCSIYFDRAQIICEDRMALEETLKEVLSSPKVGRIIHDLLNQEALIHA